MDIEIERNSSILFYDEKESHQKNETIDNYKDLFSQYYQKPPTLTEALDQMFTSKGADYKYSKALIDHILYKVQTIIINNNFDEIKSKYPNINEEDAKIIASYTCESFDNNYSPYRLTNTNLVEDDRCFGVNNISKYIFLLLSSLRKLNRFYPNEKLLYRCIKTNVKLFDYSNKNNSYFKGNTKTFWGFTSTTITLKKAKHFLSSKNNKKVGTLFTLIGDIWGYDISLFNVYHETEIILEPERKYIIEEVIPPKDNDGITYVKCKIENSKVVLVEINYINNNINNININNNINNNTTNIVFNLNLKNNNKNQIKKDNYQIPNNFNYSPYQNSKNINNNQIMNNYNMNNNYQNNNNNHFNAMNYNNNYSPKPNLNNNQCNLFSGQVNNNNNLIHIIWADPSNSIESSSKFFKEEGYQIHFFHDTPSCIEFFKRYHQNMNIKCIITSLFRQYSRATGNPNAFQMIEQIKRLLTNNSNLFFVMMTLNADKQQCKDFGFDLIVINDRGEMQKLVINRIKNNINLYREPSLQPCILGIRNLAQEILPKLNIIARNLDKYLDRCFCQNCEPISISYRSEPKVKYSLPIGWYRFGIKMNDYYINNNIDTSNWPIGYYGTNLNTAISIIDNQKIMFPGEFLNNGDKVPPQDNNNPTAIIMSPSIKYAKLFSERTLYNGKSIYFAFQCRIMPGTYTIERVPSKFYTDENFSDDEIEWVVNGGVCVIPFGFLISFEF